MVSHTKPTNAAIPLCLERSKKLFAAALHSKVKTTASLPPVSLISCLHFPFLSLMSTFLPEKTVVWQLLYSTNCCPCIGVCFFCVQLYTVQSRYRILQTTKVVRWKCWTIKICTDLGISKPIQPDTLKNKMNPHYSMWWKCFTLLYIIDTPVCVCACQNYSRPWNVKSQSPLQST